MTFHLSHALALFGEVAESTRHCLHLPFFYLVLSLNTWCLLSIKVMSCVSVCWRCVHMLYSIHQCLNYNWNDASVSKWLTFVVKKTIVSEDTRTLISPCQKEFSGALPCLLLSQAWKERESLRHVTVCGLWDPRKKTFWRIRKTLRKEGAKQKHG